MGDALDSIRPSVTGFVRKKKKKSVRKAFDDWQVGDTSRCQNDRDPFLSCRLGLRALLPELACASDRNGMQSRLPGIFHSVGEL